MKKLNVGFGTWAIAGWVAIAGIGYALEDTELALPFSLIETGFYGWGFLLLGGLAVIGAQVRRTEAAIGRKSVGILGEIIGLMGLATGTAAFLSLGASSWAAIGLGVTACAAWAWAAFGKKEATPTRSSALSTGGVVIAAIALMAYSGYRALDSLFDTTTVKTAATWDAHGVGYRAHVITTGSFKSDGVRVTVGRRFLIWTYANENIMGCWSDYGTPKTPKVRFEAPSTIVVYDAGDCADFARGIIAPRIERRGGYGQVSYGGMDVIFLK